MTPPKYFAPDGLHGGLHETLDEEAAMPGSVTGNRENGHIVVGGISKEASIDLGQLSSCLEREGNRLDVAKVVPV